MDLTIAASELAKGTDKSQGASINIKNNTQTEGSTKAAEFANVLISGMQVNQRELDQNTYHSLLKETDDVKEQLMQSATNAKANLKALFQRLSGADAVKIDEDGFNLNDLSQEEMVGIVDRIKIELASHGKKVYFAGEGLSTDEIEQVVGSTGMAEEISNQMSAGNLPATQENVEELAGAVDKVSQISDLSGEAKNYLVKNRLAPTIDNVYKAEYMQSQGSQGQQNAKVTVTEDEWQQLMPQAAAVIGRAGLEANGATLSTARNLLENDIPITKENILYKVQLDSLNISDLQSGDGLKQLIGSIVNGMAQGENASDTLLINSTGTYQTVANAISTVNNADIRHVAYVTENDETFNIENLRNAMNSVDAASYRFQFEIGSKESTMDFVQENVQDYQNEQVYDRYEQLQQIRILMTADAGLFLAKQGVNLNAEPIASLIEQLDAYHQAVALYAEDSQAQQNTAGGMAQQTAGTAGAAQNSLEGQTQAAVAGLSGTDSTMNMIVSSYQTVMQVKRALHDIKYAPDVSMGAVVKEKAENEVMTIADFAQKGSAFRQQFEQAGQEYRAVGTEVRKDLGDSLKKAVDASMEDILKELNLENTQANRDAVRIFAENQMEITKEGVENIKEIHSTLQNLIRNMKPETALAMIRENINPMTEDIHTVNAYLTEMNAQQDNDKEEKYSRFLYKLDQTDGISEQERNQFIGIYKMMNIFTKDAGAAIGTLVKQNEEITMENLCKAYNSRRAAGMDYTIDDEAAIPQIQEKVNYFGNLFETTGEHVTPLSLKTVQQEQTIDEHSVEAFCEDIEAAYDEDAEAAYYDEYLNTLRSSSAMEEAVIKELTDNEQPVTVNQVLAMEHIMQSGYYNSVFGEDKKDTAKAETFLEKSGDRQALEAAYDDLEEDAAKDLETAVAADDNQDYETIRDLRMRYREIGLIRNLSQRHDYRIPMVTEEGVGMIHLTLVQDAKEKGRISVHLNTQELGTVSVEAKVGSDSAELYGISDTSADKLSEKLEQAAEELKENNGFKEVEVHCQDIRTVRRVTYDKAAESVASDKLYKAAKTIVYALAGKTENA